MGNIALGFALGDGGSRKVCKLVVAQDKPIPACMVAVGAHGEGHGAHGVFHINVVVPAIVCILQTGNLSREAVVVVGLRSIVGGVVGPRVDVFAFELSGQGDGLFRAHIPTLGDGG